MKWIRSCLKRVIFNVIFRVGIKSSCNECFPPLSPVSMLENGNAYTGQSCIYGNIYIIRSLLYAQNYEIFRIFNLFTITISKRRDCVRNRALTSCHLRIVVGFVVIWNRKFSGSVLGSLTEDKHKCSMQTNEFLSTSFITIQGLMQMLCNFHCIVKPAWMFAL